MTDFVLHKLTLETLGEYLAAVRGDAGLTIEEVAEKTGVTPRFISALEHGDFHALPEPVYVVGFIKKMATAYAVPADQLVAQFYREIAIAKAATPLSQHSWKTLAARMSPLRWAVIASAGGGVIFLLACIWQVVMIGKMPTLVVVEPKADQRIQGGLVNVSGTATPGSEVALNGQTVFAGTDGKFFGTVSFLAGMQTLQVSAKSRFGKTATRTITFVVDGEGLESKVGPEMPLSTAPPQMGYADRQTEFLP